MTIVGHYNHIIYNYVIRVNNYSCIHDYIILRSQTIVVCITTIILGLTTIKICVTTWMYRLDENQNYLPYMDVQTTRKPKFVTLYGMYNYK
jgi:hypothetical protein